MSDSKSLNIWDIGKVVGITAVTLGLNHLIQNLISKPTYKNPNNHKKIRHRKHNSFVRISSQIRVSPTKSHQAWGILRLQNIKQNDALLQQLQIMSTIVCPFQRVNNLIVDLQLKQVITYPCPLLAHQIKLHKDQPFLLPASLVKPGQFVIENCVFRAGQSIQTQKKFMRAGPRATQYFDSKSVRADIVVLGKCAPGINNIIRQLTTILKQLYKVEKVTGIKFSYQGYYNKDMIDLTPELVQIIHHRGGNFLGTGGAPCHPDKIVDNLVSRGVNQLYLIGGNDTIISATQIYNQIKKRNLNIALCVNLKAINKDSAYFDTCFGFQSAVQQAQRFIQQGYAITKSTYNSAVLVKVPGRFSGFLAMDIVRAARNANVCLVPEFAYDLYGEKGLLSYITQRIKSKGYCTIVYSSGALNAARDIELQKLNDMKSRKQNKQHRQEYVFDLFLKRQIQMELKNHKMQCSSVYFFDIQNAIRTVPANSFDTKLCSQIALCSIQGLMSGYTNFAIGHFKNRVAMVPLQLMSKAQKYCLRVHDQNWQRLLATTNQPSFINDESDAQP